MFLMLKPLERKVETLFSYWIADLINLPYCEYSIHAPMETLASYRIYL